MVFCTLWSLQSPLWSHISSWSEQWYQCLYTSQSQHPDYSYFLAIRNLLSTFFLFCLSCHLSPVSFPFGPNAECCYDCGPHDPIQVRNSPQFLCGSEHHDSICYHDLYQIFFEISTNWLPWNKSKEVLLKTSKLQTQELLVSMLIFLIIPSGKVPGSHPCISPMTMWATLDVYPLITPAEWSKWSSSWSLKARIYSLTCYRVWFWDWTFITQ